MGRFQDRVAIVTGGSRGIGRTVAESLAAEGARVVVNYRTREADADATIAHIVERGGVAFACQADVTDEGAVRTLIRRAKAEYGRIDILVANAGIVRVQLLAGMTLRQWDEVIKTSLQGSFLCVREVLPHMMQQKGGNIILMSSVVTDRADRGNANYAAAKGGINALTRALAVEVASKGIRVNAVAPGAIITDMTKRIRNLVGEEILALIPLQRFGNPDDVAHAVCFLASDDASYITGEILHVTGGLEL